MAGVLTERKPFLLLLILLTLNLVLMSSSVRNADRRSLLEEAVLSITSPFLKVAAWVGRGTTGTWKSYADLRGVEEVNQRLLAENQALALKTREAEEARLELGRLRELLDLRGQVERPSAAAHVIAREESGGARILLLDRGNGAGLRTNDPVITPRGIVGRIIGAFPGSSKVQTILDPNCGVAAILQRTRAQGVIVGQGERGCRMEYVSELSDVEVGDVVVTSGLDQIYPKGYVIGVVSAIGEGEGLTKYVEVRPEVDFGRLEEVLVLLELRAPEGAAGAEKR
jgi:rod shape-determining protein MreC